MLRKECGSKITKVSEQCVLLVSPIAGKLKGVAVGLVLAGSACGFLFFCVTCGVAVVFCFCSVADNEDLNEIEHRSTSPKGITLVAVDLIERFLDGNAPAFQFNLHHRNTVHENGNVVAVFESPFVLLKLVGDLKTVIEDVGLVNEFDVLGKAVIHRQCQDIALALNHFRFILNGHLLI